MPEHFPMVGDAAPDFSLVDESGATVTLSHLRGKRVILYFYPKDDTTGCTAQACGFRDNYPLIQERRAIVLGISPDGQSSHQKFKAKYDLPFTLLVDDQHAIADAYGVWVQKSMYGRSYWGIARSHFVIDEHGIIVEAIRKVTPDTSVKKAVAALV